jgi:hypothetical protein
MFLSLVKKYRKSILLIILIAAISVFESNVTWVERYYYGGVYPKVSLIQRWLTGWLPFSLGDVLYVLLGLYIVASIFFFVRRLIKEKQKWTAAKDYLVKVFNFLAIIFIVFKLFWGLNYSREGIAYQLKLKETVYCKEDVVELIEDLIFEANRCRKQISDTTLPEMNIDSIFAQTKSTYHQINKQYNFLSIDRFSIKPSLFSPTGNYLGYTGYYNPFTGEAQVRDDIPKILLPFVACHEVAHQLGYASEEEANFIAFLVIRLSNNVYFRYSMCLEILDYALNDLFIKYYEDFATINGLKKRFQLEDCFEPQVKEDRKTIKIFFAKNKKNMSNISSVFYDQYLKVNYQKSGISSYNAVINLILQYKKHNL